jgi:hypothetical protein
MRDRAERLPELRIFTYGLYRMRGFAARVRPRFAELGVDPGLDERLLFYVYDARVARIAGRILRPAARGPSFGADNPFADLPGLSPYYDYPPSAEILFDVAGDGGVGQCLTVDGFWPDEYHERLCAAAQARRYRPASDAEGRPVAGVGSLLYDPWSERLREALRRAGRH